MSKDILKSASLCDSSLEKGGGVCSAPSNAGDLQLAVKTQPAVVAGHLKSAGPCGSSFEMGGGVCSSPSNAGDLRLAVKTQPAVGGGSLKSVGPCDFPHERGGGMCSTPTNAGSLQLAVKTLPAVVNNKINIWIGFKRIIIAAAAILLLVATTSFNAPTYKMAKLKYNGGGDWYGDRTALPNLIKFCNDNLKTNFQQEDEVVEAGSAEIFNYPFIFMTGHGNVIFSDQDVRNLRKYLTGGGFLHIDDNYGLDQFIRPQMKKVFPELDFVELPLNHPIYHQKFPFPNGLPKIHEHDGKRPQGFGLIYKGRLVCYYTYECDLGNGWEDYGTYANDTQENRLKALKMGANMIQYVLTQ